MIFYQIRWVCYLSINNFSLGLEKSFNLNYMDVAKTNFVLQIFYVDVILMFTYCLDKNI